MVDLPGAGCLSDTHAGSDGRPIPAPIVCGKACGPAVSATLSYRYLADSFANFAPTDQSASAPRINFIFCVAMARIQACLFHSVFDAAWWIHGAKIEDKRLVSGQVLKG